MTSQRLRGIMAVDPQSGYDLLEEFLRLTGLGALGGIARYLQLTYLQTKAFEVSALIATMIIGAVCGLALGWVIGAIDIVTSWQNVGAIVSGVVGLQIIYFIITVVSKVSGKAWGVDFTEDLKSMQPKIKSEKTKKSTSAPEK